MPNHTSITILFQVQNTIGVAALNLKLYCLHNPSNTIYVKCWLYIVESWLSASPLQDDRTNQSKKLEIADTAPGLTQVFSTTFSSYCFSTSSSCFLVLQLFGQWLINGKGLLRFRTGCRRGGNLGYAHLLFCSALHTWPWVLSLEDENPSFSSIWLFTWHKAQGYSLQLSLNRLSPWPCSIHQLIPVVSLISQAADSFLLILSKIWFYIVDMQEQLVEVWMHGCYSCFIWRDLMAIIELCRVSPRTTYG